MRRISLVGAGGIAGLDAELPGSMREASVATMADPVRFHRATFATGL